MVILTSDNEDSRFQGRRSHVIMMKWSMHQEDSTILGLHASNFRASKQKQNPRELQREIDESAVKVGDFNMPLSISNRTSRLKIRKKTWSI